MNTVELTDELLEEVTGGCGSCGGHHHGQRGGYEHGGFNGGYGYGGYQGPSISYSNQSLEQDFSYHLKETSTQYSIS